MDKITEQRIQLLHPKVRSEVLGIITQCDKRLTGNAKVRIVQGLRTFEEQNNLYAQGRTKPGKIVTKAKGGQSYHNYGFAIDYCLIIDGKEVSWNTVKDFDGDAVADWTEVAHTFIAAGWEWGKAFNDLPHVEKRFGLNWRKMLEMYNKGNFIAGTKYIDI
jgi:peptidoglycan L-alanyl-D-glutamate endopeptidase CwlK